MPTLPNWPGRTETVLTADLVADLARLVAIMHRVDHVVPRLGRPVDFGGRAGVAMSREDWLAARQAVQDLMPGLQAFLRSTDAADGPGPFGP